MDSHFMREWRASVRQMIRMSYSKSDISDKEIEQLVDKYEKERLNNPKVVIINNYNSKVIRLGLLELTTMIEDNKLICGGSGCLYLAHDTRRNLLIEFIRHIMASRKQAKKDRDKYQKGTYMWEVKNRAQNAFKLIINSLYGCLGYPGFTLFNIFLAESITSQGRHIITSAINAIENFLGDKLLFENENDLFNVVRQIDNEYKRVFKDNEMSPALVSSLSNTIGSDNLANLVGERYLSKCIFTTSSNFKSIVILLFQRMSTAELLIMYYKNNFMAFCENEFIKKKFANLIMENGVLLTCEDYSYKSDATRAIVAELWGFFDLFVHYNYPIFDRVRKAMYIDKYKSLYTDTDSVFLSVNEIVRYVRQNIITPKEAGLTESELRYTSANISLTLVNNMMAKQMLTLCASMNTNEEFSKLLKMKNENFLSRIMFFTVKKRYVALALISEGNLLGGGKGLPEIKGLDFIKAGTKPTVRNFYIQTCLDDILYSETISPAKIFNKMINFEAKMGEEILNGNMEFFKQATVKIPEHYKKPFSTQGINAITLWNAICPEYAMEFPNDVNIVPIVDMTFEAPPKIKPGKISKAPNTDPCKKNSVNAFRDKHPDRYDMLKEAIYLNINPLIRHMTLTSIAIPKNIDYPIPDHVKSIMNGSLVVQNNISLFLPVMASLGLTPQNVSSTESKMTNIINL